MQPLLLLLAVRFKGAGRLAALQMLEQRAQECGFSRVLFVALGQLFRFVDALFQHLDVGQNKFEIDGLNVAARVDRAVDVDDVGVVKAADDVDDDVDLADVRQKLVAQSLAP